MSGGPVVPDIRAVWQANTVFSPGDVFTYNGGVYEVTTTYTSGGSFGATDLANTTAWEAQSGTYAPQQGLLAALTQHTATKSDPNLFKAQNAYAPLTTPTYEGTGDLVHPDVVSIRSSAYPAATWNGFEYWMWATPYHAGNPAVENPSMLCSHDGITWQVPAGLTNPVIATPGGTSYNSDTDMALGPDGVMYCYWRTLADVGVSSVFGISFTASGTATTDLVFVVSTTDGVNYSAPTLLLTRDRTAGTMLSPAVVYDAAKAQWLMWTINAGTNPYSLELRTASSPLGPWSAPTVCTCVLPSAQGSGSSMWHVDVVKWGTEYHAVINDTDQATSGTNGDLFFAVSDSTGVTWNVAGDPLLDKRTDRWDTDMYRSTFQPAIIDGQLGYELWYSVKAGTTTERIGYSTISVSRHNKIVKFPGAHGMADPSLLNLIAATQNPPMPPFAAGDHFLRADAASLGTAPSGQTWVVWAGVPGISLHRAYATTAVNTKAVIDSGIANGRFSIDIVHGTAEAWLIFNGIDTNNYLRVGFPSGSTTLTLQQVVAGGSTTITTFTLLPFKDGDRLSVDRIGGDDSSNDLRIYVNDEFVGGRALAANKTGTFVGYQTFTSTPMFTRLVARSLVYGI